MAWYATAWHGVTRHGMAWHGVPWRGVAWRGMAVQIALPWGLALSSVAERGALSARRARGNFQGNEGSPKEGGLDIGQQEGSSM